MEHNYKNSTILSNNGNNSAIQLSDRHLQELLSKISIEDIPYAVKYLVDKLAFIKKKSSTETATHKWDNYQFSDQLIAMTPKNRQQMTGDYKTELSQILEKKYK